ncbi:MAG: peptide deformylase [Patescibacteria group bacterium]
MIRKILKVTDSRLRQKSHTVKKIDKKTRVLISDLKKTLDAQKDPEGVGLAAPQIGKNLRVFIMKFKGEIQVIVNPEIVSIVKVKKKKENTKDEKIMEGCLSLPNYYGPLTRPQKIKIKYTSEDGKQIVEVFEGFKAQIIQHEIDHLNGMLFVNRLLEQKKPLYELAGGEWEEVELT